MHKIGDTWWRAAAFSFGIALCLLGVWRYLYIKDDVDRFNREYPPVLNVRDMPPERAGDPAFVIDYGKNISMRPGKCLPMKNSDFVVCEHAGTSIGSFVSEPTTDLCPRAAVVLPSHRCVDAIEEMGTASRRNILMEMLPWSSWKTEQQKVVTMLVRPAGKVELIRYGDQRIFVMNYKMDIEPGMYFFLFIMTDGLGRNVKGTVRSKNPDAVDAFSILRFRHPSGP